MKICFVLILLQALALHANEGKGCMPPVAPYHGKYVPLQTKYKPDDSIYYVCDKGFRSFGPDRRICTRNGTWNQSAAYCGEMLHGVSVDEKMWDVVLDGNHSSCTRNKSASLSFNYDKSFNEAVFRIYSLVNDATDLHITVNKVSCERITVPKVLQFQESKCSFVDVKRNTRPNIIIAHLTSSHFCEVEIYPVRGLKCNVLTGKPNTFIKFEPVLESRYVNYGTAALHYCGEGYELVGEQIRYCIGHNQWSGPESYCQSNNLKTIIIAVSAAVGGIMLSGVIGIVFCLRIGRKNSALRNSFGFEYVDDSISTDMHFYNTVNYDEIPEPRSKMPLPEIPVTMGDYSKPIDAKAESVVGSIYAEPECAYNIYGMMANTVPVTEMKNNPEIEFKAQHSKKRATSMDAQTLQIMLRTETGNNNDNIANQQVNPMIKNDLYSYD